MKTTSELEKHAGAEAVQRQRRRFVSALGMCERDDEHATIAERKGALLKRADLESWKTDKIKIGAERCVSNERTGAKVQQRWRLLDELLCCYTLYSRGWHVV